MSGLGHNQPPSMIDVAADVTASINAWLTDHPVIQTEEEAREAKVLIDRGKLGFKDLEDERGALVQPLRSTIETINEKYRSPREILEKVTDEASRRATDWLAKEQAKKIKIAEEARKAAEAAELAAREADARETEAKEDARLGVESDVAAAVSEADRSFQEYSQAARLAARADRDTKVRIGGGFSRALSLRNRETLTVTDAISAITAIGMTPDIMIAILKGARAYRTMTGELPPGIESKMEQSA